jgi:hypothetical protein
VKYAVVAEQKYPSQTRHDLKDSIAAFDDELQKNQSTRQNHQREQPTTDAK